MAHDLERLRPTELTRLLNANIPDGCKPINVRTVRKHQNEAGLRIGDGERIHLLKYAAWLRGQWNLEKPNADPSAKLRDDYELMKERARARNEERSLTGRDIGPLPAVVDPERRAAGLACLETFCLTYLRKTFHRPFSRSHRKAAKKIERACRQGGMFAFAMPRGFGKSSLAKAACLWAILNGYRKFACLIAASATMGEKRLAEIKTWCEAGKLLHEDFPEVFYPIKKLGRLAGKAPGQLYRGVSTRIIWSANIIVFPTIEGSPASGSVISACGLKGSEVRGQSHGLADGTTIRPDFVLLDDPQTRESARSVLQCDEREETIFADVMGMADSTRGIAVFAAVTVICKGDLASRLLDRNRHPDFQGERTPMLWSFPTNMALWDKFAQIRFESLKADGDGREADEFYLANREEMDRGAEAAWEEFYLPSEVSAIHHAMILKIKNHRAFMAECQNDPEDAEKSTRKQLTVDIVCQKVNGIPRRTIPIRCIAVTTHIDVHDHILYWVCMAWEPDFTGYVIDYGTYPKQPIAFFRQANPPLKLCQVRDPEGNLLHPGASKEAVIISGLDRLTGELFDREYIREDKTIFHIGKMLLDAKYETESVKSFCRRSRRGDMMLPAMGYHLRPGENWYSHFNKKPGGQTGYHWRIPPAEDGQRYVLMDTDHWKSMARDRILISHNDPGSWSLFGSRPIEHEPIAEHCCSQRCEWIVRNDHGKEHWVIKPGAPDDHWWDDICGAAAAAAMAGVSVPGVIDRKIRTPRRTKDQPRVSYL